MSIPGLAIIAESINDSVPSTHTMFEQNNLAGIVDLARQQAEKGATVIDVNVGPRAPEFMSAVVRAIQEHVAVPLSIDTPDPAIAAAGLEAYDPQRAGGRQPILNSISQGRLEMFDLYAIQPFMPILLTTEGKDAAGDMVMNESADQVYATATTMVAIARERIPGLSNDRIILDPGIMPIGSDLKGDFKRLMKTLELVHADRSLAGVSMSVGLSNFTAMLPSKKPDGSPVKGPLESAFLTMAMPLGLNTIVGSVKRRYALLNEDDPAMLCLRDALALDGVEAVMRVMMFLS